VHGNKRCEASKQRHVQHSCSSGCGGLADERGELLRNGLRRVQLRRAAPHAAPQLRAEHRGTSDEAIHVKQSVRRCRAWSAIPGASSAAATSGLKDRSLPSAASRHVSAKRGASACHNRKKAHGGTRLLPAAWRRRRRRRAPAPPPRGRPRRGRRARRRAAAPAARPARRNAQAGSRNAQRTTASTRCQPQSQVSDATQAQENDE
jgi:hypothetical protein